MERYPLNALGEVTLDANGNGQVELKPTYYTESWLVTSASIVVSTNVLLPVFKLFSNGTFVDGTDDGSLNYSGLYEILQTNMPMKGVWTGGDAGAIAQLRLGGVRFIK